MTSLIEQKVVLGCGGRQGGTLGGPREDSQEGGCPGRAGLFPWPAECLWAVLPSGQIICRVKL